MNEENGCITCLFVLFFIVIGIVAICITIHGK